MIQLNIISKSHKQADELVQILIKKNLAINVFKIDGLISAVSNKEGINYHQGNTMITGQTKALLFNKIDQLIRSKYKKDMPLVYSLAIVNMDWEQADLLIQETIKV